MAEFINAERGSREREKLRKDLKMNEFMLSKLAQEKRYSSQVIIYSLENVRIFL